jgi:YbbR domain-containing protein
MIPFVRNFILEDFWLKLFSFVLAVLTWFTINSMAAQKEGLAGMALPLATNSGQLTISNLPVVILSSAQDVRSFRVNPSEVSVTVRGDQEVLKSLQNRDIRVLVDLTGIGSAQSLRKRIEVSTPAGVTHVRVNPEDVEVIFPAGK